MTTLAAPADWMDDVYARLGGHHIKAAGAAEPATVLAGRLSVSKSGWGLLSVPNALARGLFDALDEPGCELPPGSRGGPFNAHISVIRPEELARIGGPDRLSERGHTFRYQLGRVETVEPAGWAGMSRVWLAHVDSPALVRLRRSYGLSDLPDNNSKPFHLTFAVRRKHVLRAGEAGVKGREPGEEPVSPFKDGDPGAKMARDRKPLPPDWKEPADREDCPSCGVMHERDNGRCNACGEVWPAKTAALPPVVIDRPRGFKKTFQTRQGRMELEYPLDYGYFDGTVNPQDGDGADVFVGSGGPLHGRFMKGTDLTGVWQPDEHKWYTGLTPEEHAGLMAWWARQNPDLVRDDTRFADAEALASDLAGMWTPPSPPGKTAALVSEDELRESGRKLLAKGKAAVEAVLDSLDEEEADGLYCYFHPDQGLWVDVCDWGDPDAGERVVRAFCEAAGLEDEEGERPNPFVRVENEAAKPGTGWERLG